MALFVVARSQSVFEQASGRWPAGRPAPEVMEAVQRSCQAVADRPVRLAEVFYRHLFEMAPATRAMFATDMTDQMQKMTDTLLAAIAQLSTYETADLEVVLYRMGREHFERYQVEPEHYMYVAHALTRAVRDVAGWEYTSYLSSCWIALSQWVTGHMIAGTRAAMKDTEPENTDLPTQRHSTAGRAQQHDNGADRADRAGVVPAPRAPAPPRRSSHRRTGATGRI